MSFKTILNKGKTTYKNLPIQVKASVWFVISTVLLKGISFITVPIFTRLMSKEQYGLYSVYLTWGEVFAILGTFGLESCAYLSVLTKFDEEDMEEAQISLLELSFFITSILMVAVLLFEKQLSKLISIPWKFLVLMVLQIYFIPVLNFWSTKKRFQYRYKSLVAVSILMSIFNAALGVFVVLNVSESMQAFGRAISIVSVQAIFGILMLFLLLKDTQLRFSTRYWKWGVQVHLPLLPHTLSLKVLAGADRIMINTMIGATATALYSVAYSIAIVVNLIKASIVDALRPWMYSCIKEHRTENMKSVINGVLLLISMLTLIFVAFAPEVIKIVAPSDYYEAVYCMPPVMISSFFTFLYSIFSVVEIYFEETKKVMAASIAAAVLNIVLNAVFIKKFGYIAAAFTTLVCYISLSLFHYVMASIVMKKNDLNISFFDKKSILIISISLIGLMLLFELFYTQTLLRYILLITIVVFLFVKRKYFVGLIKIIRKK